jgi:hypothetical protein
MMTDIELEDKYERFLRNTDIDLQAEIAAGGSDGGLANYYTKTEANAITTALDNRVSTLENAGGVGDLSNYYTKGETNGLLASKQSTNAVLTQLIGLSPVNDDIIQRKANAWTTRSPNQLKLDLSLDNVSNTSDANKPISTATQGALNALDARVDTLEAGGGTDLSNYYTKTQVDTSFSALTKASVGLGNADNTSDATKNAAVASLTNKDLTSGTNTFPTFNQSTTGNAATATKLTTARTINGVGFDGTANITVADATKVPTTRTVNSKALSANISLDKTDIGLANVDNTADTAKPISTAMQAALDLKAALTVTNALDTRISTLETTTVATLTYSATVTPNANTAKSFKLAMTGDAALAVPTNGAEGNRLFIAVTASGADRTLTLNGSYRLTTGTSATIVIPNSKTQYIGLRYNGTNWTVIASTQEL